MKLTRRSFLLSSSPALLAQRRRPPNVIFLLTDDQGYGDLGCHGNRWIRTPHLNRLHAESVRFLDHHSDPLCAPTRAGLLTGQYALRNAVTAAAGGWSILRPGAPTLAEIFQRNGYRTGIFGKWHLGENFPMRPSDRGFHESVVCRSGGVAQAADYWGNKYFNDHYYEQNTPKAYKGYCTDVFFDLGKRFIERNRDRPFFLYLPMNAPHAPFLVDDRYSEPYKKMGIPPPAAEFYGMIENIDENLGKLRALLSELRLADDTILVFMTDNGSSTGSPPAGQKTEWKGYSSGMRAAKGSPYEGGHRVPLFIHWPRGGWSGGRDVSELTCHLDVFPTLADLCGLDLPAGLDLDGHSLAPLLRADGAFPRGRAHFIEHHQIRRDGRFEMERPRPWMNSVALMSQWRLVQDEELYDIRKDPGQKQNVAARYPDVVKQMRRRYGDWWNRMYTGLRQWTRIPIGSPRADPVDLSCFDWHGDSVPANQAMIFADFVANGVWALHAERAGAYEITLRQRPSYVRYSLQAERAKVWINGRELPPRTIQAGERKVVFTVALAQGNVNLGTELIDGDRRRGAYFVDVRFDGDKG